MGVAVGLFVGMAEASLRVLAGVGLGHRTGLPVNTLNAARTGNHSVHSLVRLIGTLAPLEPDVVVLMHNVNDLTTLLREGDYWNDNASRGLLARPGCKRPGCHFRRGVAKTAERLVPALSARLGAARGPTREFDAPAEPPDSDYVADRFRRSLVTFVETSRTWGITPVLMTQANRFTPDPQPTLGWSPDEIGVSYTEYRALYVAFNAIIRAVAADHEVPLVDLAETIPADLRHLYDYVHLTDDGSRLVAAEVVDALPALQLLQ